MPTKFTLKYISQNPYQREKEGDNITLINEQRNHEKWHKTLCDH